MPERDEIIIVGAGIGGLTAALAIARAGFPVLVCERAAALAEVGAGIQLSPNAGRALAGLDLETAVAAAATEPVAIDVRNGQSGTLLAEIPIPAYRERYGFPYRVIHRAELQAILLAAVRATPGTTLRLDARVVDVKDLGTRVEATLDGGGGREVVTGSAIVAADGVWSATRAVIDPRPARPTGRTAWRAVISAAHAPQGVDITHSGLWLGRNAHLVHYPIARGAALNLVAIVEETWLEEGWSTPGDPAVLARNFEGWAETARKLIATPTEWLKWALVAVAPEGPWHKGRIALLGDSAHAMTPYLAQGAAMAIEDAVVLARWLAAIPKDVPGALAAYERERKPRVTRVWHRAKDTGDQYHFGAVAGAMRDTALRVAGPRFVLGMNDWLYGWQPPVMHPPAQS